MIPDSWIDQVRSSLLRLDARRRELAPELSYGRHRGPVRSDVRSAAILVLIEPGKGNEGWSIPLTKRSSRLSDHAGQISFPGGRMETGEDAWMAAIREAREELGVELESLSNIGMLDPIFVFASNYLVYPCLAISREPVDYRPNPDEVDELLRIPVRELVAWSKLGTKSIQRGTYSFQAPYFEFRRHRIWGATAIILHEVKVLAEGWASIE